MVRVLDAAATAALLARHPEIRADAIPSWGVTVTDDFEGETRDYLVGLVHSTGEIRVVDITASNDYWFGQMRIDPENPGIDWTSFWESLNTGLGGIGGAIGFAVLVIGAIWLWNRIK